MSFREVRSSNRSSNCSSGGLEAFKLAQDGSGTLPDGTASSRSSIEPRGDSSNGRESRSTDASCSGAIARLATALDWMTADSLTRFRGTPVLSGFLRKKNRKLGWSSRYFVLFPSYVYYVKKPQDTFPLAYVPMRDVALVRLMGDNEPMFQLVLRSRRAMTLQATNLNQAKHWVVRLSEFAHADGNHDLNSNEHGDVTGPVSAGDLAYQRNGLSPRISTASRSSVSTQSESQGNCGGSLLKDEQMLSTGKGCVSTESFIRPVRSPFCAEFTGLLRDHQDKTAIMKSDWQVLAVILSVLVRRNPSESDTEINSCSLYDDIWYLASEISAVKIGQSFSGSASATSLAAASEVDRGGFTPGIEEDPELDPALDAKTLSSSRNSGSESLGTTPPKARPSPHSEGRDVSGKLPPDVEHAPCPKLESGSVPPSGGASSDRDPPDGTNANEKLGKNNVPFRKELSAVVKLILEDPALILAVWKLAKTPRCVSTMLRVFEGKDRLAQSLALRIIWVLYRTDFGKFPVDSIDDSGNSEECTKLVGVGGHFSKLLRVLCQGNRSSPDFCALNRGILKTLLFMLVTPVNRFDSEVRKGELAVASESFAWKRVHNSSLWKAVFQSLQQCELKQRLYFLVKVSELLEAKRSNCKSMLWNPEWSEWHFDLLVDLSAELGAPKNRHDVSSGLFIVVLKMLTAVNAYVFLHENIHNMFSVVFRMSLRTAVIRFPNKTLLPRYLFTLLMKRLMRGSREFSQSLGKAGESKVSIWKNLYILVQMVKTLVFLTPTIGIGQAGRSESGSEKPYSPTPTQIVSPVRTAVPSRGRIRSYHSSTSGSEVGGSQPVTPSAGVGAGSLSAHSPVASPRLGPSRPKSFDYTRPDGVTSPRMRPISTGDRYESSSPRSPLHRVRQSQSSVSGSSFEGSESEISVWEQYGTDYTSMLFLSTDGENLFDSDSGTSASRNASPAFPEDISALLSPRAQPPECATLPADEADRGTSPRGKSVSSRIRSSSTFSTLKSAPASMPREKNLSRETGAYRWLFAYKDGWNRPHSPADFGLRTCEARGILYDCAMCDVAAGMIDLFVPILKHGLSKGKTKEGNSSVALRKILTKLSSDMKFMRYAPAFLAIIEPISHSLTRGQQADVIADFFQLKPRKRQYIFRQRKHLFEKIQRDRSAFIDSDIRKSSETEHAVKNLLLLGAGQSGKSTLFKQIVRLFGSGYSEERRQQYVPYIHNYVVSNIAALLQAAEETSLTLRPETIKSRDFIFERISTFRDVEDVDNATVISSVQLDDTFAYHIKRAWSDPAIQEVYELRNTTLHVMDSAQYFFDKVSEVADEFYAPSFDDILRVRVRTTRIVQHEFEMQGKKFRLFDVGGQRNQRRKWIHCFEHVTAIIFMAALSGYNEYLHEDKSVIKLKEAISLFSEIVNSSWFQQTSVILFLNKSDLLKGKLEKYDITETFPDFSAEFSDPKDYGQACNFFKGQFLKTVKGNSKIVYVHVTQATSTANIEAVFLSVKDILLRGALMRSGLL